MYVVVSRGEESLWLVQEPAPTDKHSLVSLRTGVETFWPPREQGAYLTCTDNDFVLCFRRSPTESPNSLTLVGPLTLERDTWVPSGGDQQIRVSGSIGFIPTLGDPRTIWVNHSHILEEFDEDAVPTGVSYEVGDDYDIIDWTSGADWWVAKRGGPQLNFQIMHQSHAGEWRTYVETPDANLVVEKLDDTFVGLAWSLDRWDFYRLHPDEETQWVGGGPAPFRDPTGGLPAAVLKQGGVLLEQASSYHVSCEGNSCSLKRVNMTNAQLDSVASVQIPGDGASLVYARHLGCGTMEYVARTSETLWVGRLSPDDG